MTLRLVSSEKCPHHRNMLTLTGNPCPQLLQQSYMHDRYTDRLRSLND